MKSFALLILVIATVSCAFAVEDSAIVKVFTLKEGGMIVVTESHATIGEDKTTYNATQADGKPISFDSTRVTKVEEMPMSEWKKLTILPALPTEGPDMQIFIGLRKPDPKEAAPAFHAVEPYRGPFIGVGPDEEKEKRDSDSVAGHGSIGVANTQVMTKDGLSKFDSSVGSRTPGPGGA